MPGIQFPGMTYVVYLTLIPGNAAVDRAGAKVASLCCIVPLTDVPDTSLPEIFMSPRALRVIRCRWVYVAYRTRHLPKYAHYTLLGIPGGYRD